MRASAIVTACLLAAAVLAGQDDAVLRIAVSVPDASGHATPVPRHVLLVSDNPASGPPRTIRTGVDGTVELSLAPGSYAIESERAVLLDGRPYEWFEYLDLAAGDRVTLELTAANAAAPATGTDDGEGGERSDPAFLLGRWQRSVAAVWTPTARAGGVVVDADGLIATDARVIGDATDVSVQFSTTVKVPAVVLQRDATTRVAIVRVNRRVTAELSPLPLACDAEPRRIPPGTELLAITTEMGRPTDMAWGRVISAGPPRLATDITMSQFGGGSPVFDTAGDVVGLTTIRVDPDSPRWHEVEVVPTARVCEALSAARALLASAAEPVAARLPVEPSRPFPDVHTDGEPAAAEAAPPMLESGDFDVAVITPPVIRHGRGKAGWTSSAPRAPDVAARLGPVTDFGTWNDYFADAPAVVVVRATPRMTEGFWRRLGREAARTQGANLPPMRRFTTSFVGMTLACEGSPVTPIHPFVLEHALGNETLIREGLHVFDPSAFDAGCDNLTITLQSERGSDTIDIPPAVAERITRDFAPWWQEP